jgi:hypothetical protein
VAKDRRRPFTSASAITGPHAAGRISSITPMATATGVSIPASVSSVALPVASNTAASCSGASFSRAVPSAVSSKPWSTYAASAAAFSTRSGVLVA